MTNEHNKIIRVAGPATPVQIIGLNGVPEVAINLWPLNLKKTQKKLPKNADKKKIIADRKSSGGLKLSDVYKQIHEGEIIDVNVIIKADNSGSVEVLKQV